MCLLVMQCSVTCGGGERVREVECVITNGTFIDMNNKTQTVYVVLNETACDPDRKPSSTRECNTYPCVFRWSAGRYGPVSFQFPCFKHENTMCPSVWRDFPDWRCGQ